MKGGVHIPLYIYELHVFEADGQTKGNTILPLPHFMRRGTKRWILNRAGQNEGFTYCSIRDVKASTPGPHEQTPVNEPTLTQLAMKQSWFDLWY